MKNLCRATEAGAGFFKELRKTVHAGMFETRERMDVELDLRRRAGHWRRRADENIAEVIGGGGGRLFLYEEEGGVRTNRDQEREKIAIDPALRWRGKIGEEGN